MQTSDWIAGFSFVVSGAAFGWTMYRDLADRPSLKVSCFIARIHGQDFDSQQDHMAWSVTNAGRRPIVVKHIGGVAFEKNKHMIIIPHEPLPRTLQPYDTFTEFSPDLESLQQMKSACVWDTLNRMYRVPQKTFEQMKRQLADGTIERGAILTTGE